MAYDKILVIEDPLHIHAILRNVINNESPVNLRLHNTEHQATTRIIGIDFDEHYLLLDELVAGDEVEKKIKPGSQLVIFGEINAVKFRFKSRLIETGENNHVPYYRINYPAELEYAQRRQLYRLELGEDWRFPVQIIDEQATYDACAQNISLGGVNIKCDESLDAYQRRDSLKLLLSFPDSTPIPCSANICDIRQSGGNQSNLACKFVELDDQKVKLIQNYIFKVQRESRQQNSAV